MATPETVIAFGKLKKPVKMVKNIKWQNARQGNVLTSYRNP